ncbi:MAG TPA: YtxH domain-containing protein, partial [Vicinamibacteria bacterium]
MKPLSEQLADLSARAKKAEDAAAAARTETRGDVQARADKLQADADARAARMEQDAASAKDKVAGQWAGMQAQVKAG